MRAEDARVLHGASLADERQIYMDYNIPETGHKRPFSYDFVEGKLFLFESEEDRVTESTGVIATFFES